MGGVESKKKIRNLVSADVVGTEQLEELWRAHGGKESMAKSDVRLLVKELTKIMRIKASDHRIDSWIEKCRSSQGYYMGDDINFLHFKRLYLAVLSSTNTSVNLSYSLQVVLPSCLNNEVFGVPIMSATIRRDPLAIIPSFIVDLIGRLELPENIVMEGLYRIPGNETRMQQQIQRLDMGMPIQFDELKVADLCGLIVKFLNYLPESLYGDLISDFKIIAGLPKHRKKEEFAKLIALLPCANREAIHCLAKHFANVVSHEDVNKVSIRNLGICVGNLGSKILDVVIECSNDPNVFVSTVKYALPYEEAALRSNCEIPSPFLQIIPFLNENAPICGGIYPIFTENLNHFKRHNELQIEFTAREIIYQLNDNKELDLASVDIIPASVALRRFIESSTESIWGHLEQELCCATDNPEEFMQTFELLSPVHSLCVMVLSEHISILSKYHNTVQDWCDLFPCCSIPKIMPHVIQYYV